MPSRLAELEAALARGMVRLLGPHQLNHLVRFEPVLGLLRTGGGRVLDVGSGTAGVTQLLWAEWTTTALDVAFGDQVGDGPPRSARVLGDVRRLPMPDNSFDVVVALDLLEHLHRDDRGQAVSELCRVARRQTIIACPTGEAAFEADRRLASHLGSRGREKPEWLAEHLDRGFPDGHEVVDAAGDFGRVQAWGHESISHHERLIRAELSRVTVVPARLLSSVLVTGMRSSRPWPRRFATEVLARLRGRDRPPTYRTLVSVDLDGGS